MNELIKLQPSMGLDFQITGLRTSFSLLHYGHRRKFLPTPILIVILMSRDSEVQSTAICLSTPPMRDKRPVCSGCSVKCLYPAVLLSCGYRVVYCSIFANILVGVASVRLAGDKRLSGPRAGEAKSPGARRALLLMERWQHDILLSKSSTACRAAPTQAAHAEEDKVAHPSDSSQTCTARWLPAAAGKTPGSE